MYISILGLGLIGGSIARATRRHDWTVTAWTPNGNGRGHAEAFGITVAATLEEAVAGAELIVIAAPPLAALELIDDLAALGSAVMARDAVVTDVVSTKAAIVDRARRVGIRFVGGHPMAGRETSGFAASDADLFVGRPWVVVPADPPDRDADARVEALVRVCGAEVVHIGAREHDAAVAVISHVPLVLSAALVEAAAKAPAWRDAERLTATGWAAMTRLARGDVEMGAGILATNSREVETALARVAEVLAGWSEDLRREDAAQRTAARLAAARRALLDAGGSGGPS